MEQNDNPGQLILTLLLDEVRKVIRDELADFREILQPDVSRPKPGPERKRFYTIKEAAMELSLSTATVRRLIDRELLRPWRATRHIRISNEELERFSRSTT